MNSGNKTVFHKNNNKLYPKTCLCVHTTEYFEYKDLQESTKDIQELAD